MENKDSIKLLSKTENLDERMFKRISEIAEKLAEEVISIQKKRYREGNLIPSGEKVVEMSVENFQRKNVEEKIGINKKIHFLDTVHNFYSIKGFNYSTLKLQYPRYINNKYFLLNPYFILPLKVTSFYCFCFSIYLFIYSSFSIYLFIHLSPFIYLFFILCFSIYYLSPFIY